MNATTDKTWAETGGREGPRRLGIVLSVLFGGLCAALMTVVLVIYGTPHNPLWWGIMAAIQIAAVVAPPLAVPAVDWVIDGYRRDEV